MSALVNMFGWHPLTIEIDSDDSTIWVRGRNTTVSLALTAAQLDQLEAVIAVARQRLALEAA